MRNVHLGGDGSAAGIVAALGWETILAKTSQEALLFAVDALAKKIGLVAIEPAVRGSEVPGIAIPDFPMEEKGVPPDESAPVIGGAVTSAKPGSPIPDAPDSSWPEIAAPGDMGYALAQPGGMAPVKPSYGMDDDEEITSEHRLPVVTAQKP
jgi:hypothetical protein